MLSKHAFEVLDEILVYFYTFGPPKSIITDQGSEFVNQWNDEILSKFQVKHLIKSGYHSWTNGQDEWTNQTLKTAFSKLIYAHTDDWDTFIHFAINSTKQSSIKLTPFKVVFGHDPYLFSQVGSSVTTKALET